MRSAPKKIKIIDYGLGNLFSVKQALLQAGADAEITSDYREVLSAEALVLPGVGAFPEAMKNLKKNGLDRAILESLSQNKKLMGVCLGLQLLFESSEEFGASAGFGLLKGQVKLLPQEFQGKKLHIPQIAWNRIHPKSQPWQNSPLNHLSDGAYMYFVHSYYVAPTDPADILTETSYEGFRYTSSILHKNIFAVQFHPEKSAAAGVDIYKNWLQTV